LECDSWQLASVRGKHGNEFIFQGHELLAKLFVKLPRNPTKRSLRFFELGPRVLVRLDHVASRIKNADHSIM
jgi:hypothetical protein